VGLLHGFTTPRYNHISHCLSSVIPVVHVYCEWYLKPLLMSGVRRVLELWSGLSRAGENHPDFVTAFRMGMYCKSVFCRVFNLYFTACSSSDMLRYDLKSQVLSKGHYCYLAFAESRIFSVETGCHRLIRVFSKRRFRVNNVSWTMQSSSLSRRM